MLALTDYLGQAVFDREDVRVGTVADLAARLGELAPRVSRLLVRTRRRRTAVVPWEDVADFERSGVTLRRAAAELDPGAEPAADELRLMRDVVDTQIVAGVDVGVASLIRRLGLRRLARRLRGRSVPWSELYAASPAAHAVQLRVDRARVARLGPAGLAQVVGLLPPTRGAELLGAVDPDLAAKAVNGARPAVGAQVVAELGRDAHRFSRRWRRTNIPVGTSVAIPMQGAGFDRGQQFRGAVLTSAPQPFGAVIAYLAVEQIDALLPFSFVLAAGRDARTRRRRAGAGRPTREAAASWSAPAQRPGRR